jgi:general L-amino acid transport system substrate-binding protein
MKKVFAATAAVLAFGTVVGTAHAGPTFDAVKARGNLICGVNPGVGGFAAPDSQGNYEGLDVDVCRAVAAAVFGDSEKIQYVPLSAQQRFTALQSGEVDLLARNTTNTLSRDRNGMNFGPTNFYDGQGFMVPKALGVTSAKELDGATVCVQTGTTTELNLADYFRKNNMTLNSVAIEQNAEVISAYASGRCDAFTTDGSQLASIRVNDLQNPDDHIILPEIISKEPLAPAVRHGDDDWLDVMTWALNAMIIAEEKGVTSANVDEMAKSDDPELQRLLGTTEGMGAALGLDNKWAYNIIKQVGNYGESYARNVGMDSALQLERGLNAQWTEGGLLYAPPAR